MQARRICSAPLIDHSHYAIPKKYWKGSKLTVPLDAVGAGIGDYKIVTFLCPGGKERMRRLMELVANHRINLRPLLTHTFPLERILEAYELFGNRGEGVIKVAIKVNGASHQMDAEC